MKLKHEFLNWADISVVAVYFLIITGANIFVNIYFIIFIQL